MRSEQKLRNALKETLVWLENQAGTQMLLSLKNPDAVRIIGNAHSALSQPSQPMPEAAPKLPFDVEFAASYLDGVMEGEQEEIRSKWAKIRRHLSASPAAPEGAKAEDQKFLDRFERNIEKRNEHVAQVLAAKPEQTSGEQHGD